VNRYYRLTSSSDIQRVRRMGKSVAHPLLVLVYIESSQTAPWKAAVITGKSIGGAVIRNRARRQIKEALRLQQPPIMAGNELIIIARKEIVKATYDQIVEALQNVLQRAKLVDFDHVR